MWNLIFQVLALLFCTVCFYRLAMCYGDKFKAALAEMKGCETSCGKYRFADYLEFRQCRLAAILFEVATYVCLYFALRNLSALFN